MRGMIVAIFCLLFQYHGSSGQPQANTINGCKFNDQIYQTGDRLIGCLSIYCDDNGNWAHDGGVHPNCGSCEVQLWDNTIKTFHGSHYKSNGTCDFALVQEGTSYDPSFGIFTHYRKCLPNDLCSWPVTFMDNSGVVIEMGEYGSDPAYRYKINVNGEPIEIEDGGPRQVRLGSTEYPLLAMRYRGCVRILGSNNLAIQRCGTSLTIWSSTDFHSDIYGLCGHYDGATSEDFTKRDGQAITLSTFQDALDFTQSWALEHSCEGNMRIKRQSDELGECDLSESDLALVTARCETVLAENIDQLTVAVQVSFIGFCEPYLCSVLAEFPDSIPVATVLPGITIEVQVIIELILKALETTTSSPTTVRTTSVATTTEPPMTTTTTTTSAPTTMPPEIKTTSPPIPTTTTTTSAPTTVPPETMTPTLLFPTTTTASTTTAAPPPEHPEKPCYEDDDDECGMKNINIHVEVGIVNP